MKVGDLVRVVYDGTVGLIVRIDDECLFGAAVWIYLHTGESFRSEKLELVNASR